MKHLQKYLQYIKNTGIQLTTDQFDDDWEPIGPMVRGDLVREKLVTEVDGIIAVAE